MALPLVTNLMYTVFSTAPLFTTLLSLYKSTGTVFNLSISNSSTPNFAPVKSVFLADSDVSTPVAFLNLLLSYN